MSGPDRGGVLGRARVRTLEPAWQSLLTTIATEAKLPTDETTLATQLAALSATYNEGKTPQQQQALLGPRLLFSLPRDLQKGAAAVRELVATGLLTFSNDAPLRVLDLGAGMGAATLGVIRALETAGQEGRVDATWLDQDAPALRLGARVLEAAQAQQLVRSRVTIHERAGQLDEARSLGQHDLVVACQVLCELDLASPQQARVGKLADRVAKWLDRVADHGSLIVIEPALRDRTRTLHHVHDELSRRRLATVFAPCLHQARCPALDDEGDWCHEDLDVDLPTWLHPIAKRAGLRWQGLTFSYLVLRKDGQSLATLRPQATQRTVSDARPQKGKCERFLCGRFLDGDTRQRVTLLDRHRDDHNRALRDAPRGALLAVDPPLAVSTPRLAPETKLVIVDE